MSRVASATSVVPHADKRPFPPNVPVPSVRTGTLNPERPNCRYSMIHPPRLLVQSINRDLTGVPSAPVFGVMGGLIHIRLRPHAFGDVDFTIRDFPGETDGPSVKRAVIR